MTGSSFSKNVNTNEIISNIYNSIDFPEDWVYHRGYGNPLAYYEGLIDFLYPNDNFPIVFLHLSNYINKSMLDVYKLNSDLM